MDLDVLLAASTAGGATCLSSVTELAPAAGPFAAIAPAKLGAAEGKLGTYAYETRYLDDEACPAVIVDSKQSQLNRAEQGLRLAIEDGHPLLGRLPRVVVRYDRNGVSEQYTDLELPHRAFDGHIRAGSVGGTAVTQTAEYRAVRDASPANARALLDASPVSVVFGAWDSSRSSRQGRWRSALVGEIVGFCSEDRNQRNTMKGGARVDPVGMQVKLTGATLQGIADRQRGELSATNYTKVSKAVKDAKSGTVSASPLGLGGVPPSLSALAGVSCQRIIRSHVLSFAALRQIRFGAGAQGDAACRALLAALALNALARSDAELVLRANCDLVEKAPPTVTLDQRGGAGLVLEPLSIEASDELLAAALAHAESVAGVVWNGPVLQVEGDPAIVAGAVDEDIDTAKGA